MTTCDHDAIKADARDCRGGDDVNYKGLELKLRKIVEKRLEEGWTLSAVGLESYFPYDGTARCCAIGSVVADEPNTPFHEVNDIAAKRLRVSPRITYAIAGGFEGGGMLDDTDRRAYAIGARIRRDYCEYANE